MTRVREITVEPAKGWSDAAQAIARWVTDVQSILNGGVSTRDQTRGVVRETEWVQGTTITLATGLRAAPLEVRLLRGALDTAPSDYVSGGAVEWSFGAGRLSIADCTALTTAGGRYRLTLLVVED